MTITALLKRANALSDRLAAKPTPEQMKTLEIAFPPMQKDKEVFVNDHVAEILAGIPEYVRVRGNKARLTKWGKQRIWTKKQDWRQRQKKYLQEAAGNR